MGVNCLPEWVSPSPQRERFPDPLGVQADVDYLADKFLPGITSLTERARYYSFLCWSLRNSGGGSRALGRADRRLAQCEFDHHSEELQRRRSDMDDPEDESGGTGLRCRFRGVRLLTQFDGHPPRWLRTLTWQLYRSSMRNAGLVERSGRDGWSLTADGHKLADHYGRGLRSNSSSLPLLCERDLRKARERAMLLAVLFGAGPRAATAKFLGRYRVTSSTEALQIALRRRKRPVGGVESLLWLAGVHELASLGLHALFIHWYKMEPRLGSSYLRLKRRSGRVRSLATSVNLDDSQATWDYAWPRLQASWTAMRTDGGAELLDTAAGKALQTLSTGLALVPPRSIDELHRLAQTLSHIHAEAKGSDLWWTFESGRIRRLRADVIPRLSTHSYRINAALSLRRDLR